MFLRAQSIIVTLKELSQRGNTILEQNVDYAIVMGMEEMKNNF